MTVTTNLTLDRQASRRGTGVATLSLLTGPVGASGRIWQRWAESQGRPVVRLHDLTDAAKKWTWELARRADLITAALTSVARWIGRDPPDFRSDWQHKSPADANFFWESICPLPESSPLRILGDLALRRKSRRKLI